MILFWVVGIWLCAVGFAGPQVTAEDYKRADGLRNKTQGLVYNATLEAHWLEGRPEFWYRSDVRKVRQFILVNAPDEAKPAQETRE
jgi:hypothetical protein